MLYNYSGRLMWNYFGGPSMVDYFREQVMLNNYYLSGPILPDYII